MEAARTEAYLRTACSVLGFEIGELWCAGTTKRPILRFLQLYSSPSYKDEHKILVRPDSVENQKEHNHQFSPMICRCVCEGGQIVWANTRALKGLTGRKDLALNTAVGVPACTVGNDLVILVLYSVNNIKMNPTAIEVLCNIARISALGGGGFLPASQSVTCKVANTQHFVGVWDMVELISKYIGEVAFHALPLTKMYQFFDYQEYSTFKEVLNDKLIIAQATGCTNPEDDGSGPTTLLLKEREEEGISRRKRRHSLDLPMLTTQTSTANLPAVAARAEGFTEREEEGVAESKGEDKGNSSNSDSSTSSSSSSSSSSAGSSSDKKMYIDGSQCYRKNPTALHEFMMALLGMSKFRVAELWFESKKHSRGEMYVAAALHQGKEEGYKKWTSNGKSLRMKSGQDLPGQALQESQPCLDENYNSHSEADSSYPRSKIASEIPLRTAMAIPLPGSDDGPSGVLALYSPESFNLDPAIVGFVQKALNVLFTNVWDHKILDMMDVESIMSIPENALVDWVANNKKATALTPSKVLLDSSKGNSFDSSSGAKNGYGQQISVTVSEGNEVSQSLRTNPFSLKLNLMGSLGDISGARGSPLVGSLGNEGGSCMAKNLADNTYDPLYGAEVAPAHNSPAGNGATGVGGRSKRRSVAFKRDYAYGDTLTGTFCTTERQKICKSQHCQQVAAGRSPFCSTHSDTRRCQYPGCIKCAQGATKFCIGHGGGRRCTFLGCTKGARDKNFCAAHGGGKRCTQEGCTKSAVGGSGLCTAHGGGKRCQVPGCSKSSQSSTMFCVRHGGGRKCIARGCSKVARGRTDYCASHGGVGNTAAELFVDLSASV